MGPNTCIYLPDDRTIVADEEAAILKMLARATLASPAHLSGADWEPFSHAIFAYVINNKDGMFAKAYDLRRTDDAVMLSLCKGVDRWLVGVDDSDEIVAHATAVWKMTSATQSSARSNLLSKQQGKRSMIRNMSRTRQRLTHVLCGWPRRFSKICELGMTVERSTCVRWLRHDRGRRHAFPGPVQSDN